MENNYLLKIGFISKKNKYLKIYNSIIARGLERGLNDEELLEKYGYMEKHHILPKSFGLGGEKDMNNIVFLTAREHFIVHLCMTKMFDGLYDIKMNYALNQLKASNGHQKRYFNSRFYNRSKLNRKNYIRVYLLDKVKYIYSEDNEQINNYISMGWSFEMTPEFKIGRVGGMLGKAHSKETKEKISESNKGKAKAWMLGSTRSEQTKLKTLKTRLSNKNKNRESYQRAYEKRKMEGGFDFLIENPPMLGKKHTDETKSKISEATKIRLQKLKENNSEYQRINKKKSDKMKSVWEDDEYRKRAHIFNSKIYKKYNMTQNEFFISKIRPLLESGLSPKKMSNSGVIDLSRGTISGLIKKYGNDEDRKALLQIFQKEKSENNKIKDDPMFPKA